MGWSLRKTFKLGPLNLNLSSKGIGASVGVRGARVGVNALGKGYVTGGRGPVRYHKQLDFGGGEKVNAPQSAFVAPPQEPVPPQDAGAKGGSLFGPLMFVAVIAVTVWSLAFYKATSAPRSTSQGVLATPTPTATPTPKPVVRRRSRKPETKRETSSVGVSNGYIRGPRGGCYTYTRGGNKRYVSRSLCS